jgi:alkanesulfonate monooxygenase SsuD/methylene tetrahydromethanopterin reductase-like flavin-dependent oxidoreductase (luciferase family)
MSGDVDNFPRDVAELVDWFDARDPNPHVRPVPGYGEKIPVWLLGSSLYSAQLAAQLGLPFAFASHFAPDMLFQALHLYRTHFKPSERLETVRDGVYQYHCRRQQPRCGISVYLHAAGVCEAASRRNRTAAAAGGKYASAVVRFRAVWRAAGAEHVAGGDKAKVRHGLESILRETQADEIMVNGQIFDHQARLHSFDLAMQVKEEIKKWLNIGDRQQIKARQEMHVAGQTAGSAQSSAFRPRRGTVGCRSVYAMREPAAPVQSPPRSSPPGRHSRWRRGNHSATAGRPSSAE